MEDNGLFLSIAEIAGVFVGFGALVSLLRDGREQGRVALHGVIANGLVAMIAALIPVALDQYGLSGGALWRWSSGAFLMICWVAIWAALRNQEIRAATRLDAKENPVVAFVFWGLLEAPIEIPLVVVLLGMAPTLAPALYVTSLIVGLVQAAFLLARVVFSASAEGQP